MRFLSACLSHSRGRFVSKEGSGATILVVQDLCDILLELGKLFVYTKKTHISDLCLFVMALMWMYTRLYLFPFKCVPIAYWPSTTEVVPFHTIFKVLLAVIVVLNYFWFYHIVKVALRRVVFGKKVEDTRETDSKKKKRID